MANSVRCCKGVSGGSQYEGYRLDVDARFFGKLDRNAGIVAAWRVIRVLSVDYYVPALDLQIELLECAVDVGVDDLLKAVFAGKAALSNCT